MCWRYLSEPTCEAIVPIDGILLPVVVVPLPITILLALSLLLVIVAKLYVIACSSDRTWRVLTHAAGHLEEH